MFYLSLNTLLLVCVHITVNNFSSKASITVRAAQTFARRALAHVPTQAVRVVEPFALAQAEGHGVACMECIQANQARLIRFT